MSTWQRTWRIARSRPLTRTSSWGESSTTLRQSCKSRGIFSIRREPYGRAASNSWSRSVIRAKLISKSSKRSSSSLSSSSRRCTLTTRATRSRRTLRWSHSWKPSTLSECANNKTELTRIVMNSVKRSKLWRETRATWRSVSSCNLGTNWANRAIWTSDMRRKRSSMNALVRSLTWSNKKRKRKS